MKKVIALILACMFALSALAACGDTSGVDDVAPATPEPTVEPAPAQEADEPDTQVPLAPPADDFDADRVIAVFTREDGSGTRDAFVSLTGVGDDMYVEAVVESETNQILTKVESNETAIGYVSVGSLNPNVKALEIDGVTPSNETIMDGSYKLQRPLLVCVNADKENDPLVKDFIEFLISAEGQEKSASKWTVIDADAPSYASAGLSGVLKVGGSTSVEPLMQMLAEAYIALNPDVDIEISGGGSGVGINEATEGIIDIGMSSRNLKDEEKGALTATIIALDGVAVIINPANPVTSMTTDQVRAIFTGEITRWNEVG